MSSVSWCERIDCRYRTQSSASMQMAGLKTVRRQLIKLHGELQAAQKLASPNPYDEMEG